VGYPIDLYEFDRYFPDETVVQRRMGDHAVTPGVHRAASLKWWLPGASQGAVRMPV
jgi:hypothetical protein